APGRTAAAAASAGASERSRLTSVRALGVDVVDGGERRKRRVRRRGDGLAPAREAVDHAEGRRDLEALVADPLDRADRGAARRDRVLDDEHAVAGLGRTLHPALQAVRLALLAHEEADEVLACGDRDRGAGERDR